ncbi:GntR family transcriptional regulator [Pseudorhizobium flavum]|uniref:GntR family transcriptional regulator n=1 Tax=Pseudorhizobium flavum TaxID=1335061 RepID=A0A7W9YXP8_9HYPH|nr:GntR family transcriptional regulator [Pseudorhizobium flavum]MBB6180294.1 GntR family transcriptional regulator [Pseudorhizobium flavum]CAD6618117.1 GntR family transcriptional regulator [Pseudorhizobium flavum]
MQQTAGSLPIYLQITELLIRDIAAGRLIDGEKLPPEREMAENLGIAVGTLRKALSELQAHGMLERVQGSGNYIRAVSDPKSVYAMFRLELLEGGGLPTAEVLDVARMRKPDGLPRFGTSADAHRIRRLRRLSGKPAAIEEIWLDGSYVDRIEPEDLSESLYLYYRTRIGLWIVRAEDRIGLDVVPDWSPEAFRPLPGAATVHVLRISEDQEGRRAEISRTWLDHEVARYVSRLK